jgi:hypothetical protein
VGGVASKKRQILHWAGGICPRTPILPPRIPTST